MNVEREFVCEFGLREHGIGGVLGELLTCYILL